MKTAEQPTDLVVTYVDMPAARRAVRSLERAGIEGSDITLLGDADAATRRLPNIDRDQKVVGYVVRSAVIGGLVGMVIGTALGAGVGSLAFAWLSGGMWSMVAGGAVLGAGLGVLLGGIARLPQSDAGLATIETTVDGPVTVGVHRGHPDERVEHSVDATQPLSIEHVDDDVRALRSQAEAAEHSDELA